MFVIDDERTKAPIKIWLADENDIEKDNLQQAINLSHLPFLHKWVALMPDTHLGMGMPIDGVIATIDAIIPNAVGVDIGCGVGFVSTNIPIKELLTTSTPNGHLTEAIIGDIVRNIPTGFEGHKEKQNSQVLDRAKNNMHLYKDTEELVHHIDRAYYQVGTLGGGNHFIELQEDDDGNLGIMVHSGSRNFGKQVCDHFDKVAKKNTDKWHSPIPPNHRLAYLPTDSKEGESYIHWMQLALDYAKENRDTMMKVVQSIVNKWIEKYTNMQIIYSDEINCHHNYASKEMHFGKETWVHRKGATRARLNELAVIPGAMGSYSYVVKGLGNEESFHSSAHGAGRKYSRKAALKEFSMQEVLEDLAELEVTLGKRRKKDVAEETRFAYKDINEVMANQADLVKIVKTLKTVGVVKG